MVLGLPDIRGRREKRREEEDQPRHAAIKGYNRIRQQAESHVEFLSDASDSIHVQSDGPHTRREDGSDGRYDTPRT